MDSTEFAKIGNSLNELSSTPVARALPYGDHSGTSALTVEFRQYSQLMASIAFEYSDACSILGFGQEEAISDYDATEKEAEGSFENARARLEGES